MAGILILSGLEAATNNDILQGTILQTVAANGMLTFMIQASDGTGTNSYAATIQLPSGEVPINGQQMPAGAVAGLAGILDDREAFLASFPIVQGGHCVFGLTETGDAECAWRVQFTPRGLPGPTIS